MNLQYILYVGDIVTLHDNTRNALRYYVSKYIVECSLFEDKYLEFDSEEDFMKFKLSFDLDHFNRCKFDIFNQMQDDALENVIEHANKLNW
jgi:hypothetical protein